MNGSLTGLFASLIGFNLLDFALTYYAVRRGLCKEANPMMKMFIKMGWGRALGFKMMWTMLIGLWMMSTNNAKGLIIANVLFAGICLWNFLLMKRRMKQLRKQNQNSVAVGSVRVISVEPVDHS